MDEYFLQYLWNFQKFDSPRLTLTDGAALSVFKTGYQNHNSGPDFLEAHVKINELHWSGSVEVHYKSSDWNRHGHASDQAYQNVVLHVVWIHDNDILIDGNPIPTFEMSKCVNADLEQSYRQYINQPEVIRCAAHLAAFPEIQVRAMLDKSLAARLQQKARNVTAILEDTRGDWEETAYRVMCRSFGFKINQEAFTRLSEALPYQIIRKYHLNETLVFALIFGMAGFLDNPIDEYQTGLRTEFDFLKGKHNLVPVLMRHHWKSGKMRPANFPSVRIAQLAAFTTYSNQLFSNLLKISTTKEAHEFINRPLPEYWQCHYDFNKETSRKINLGKSSTNILIINSIVPILTAYAKYLDEVKYLEQAGNILDHLNAESNHVIDKWKKHGITPKNAADSQGLIYQYTELCKKRKCLRCNLGVAILSKTLSS